MAYSCSLPRSLWCLQIQSTVMFWFP